MGFMDKAKKMAEQAQTKLDEAQKQFNDGQGAAAAVGGPVGRVRQARAPDPALRAGPPAAPRAGAARAAASALARRGGAARRRSAPAASAAPPLRPRPPRRRRRRLRPRRPAPPAPPAPAGDRRRGRRVRAAEALLRGSAVRLHAALRAIL